MKTTPLSIQVSKEDYQGINQAVVSKPDDTTPLSTLQVDTPFNSSAVLLLHKPTAERACLISMLCSRVPTSCRNSNSSNMETHSSVLPRSAGSIERKPTVPLIRYAPSFDAPSFDAPTLPRPTYNQDGLYSGGWRVRLVLQ